MWMGTPKMVGYLAGGQVSSIFALAWLPWLMIIAQDLIDKLTPRSAIRSAAVLAVIILIDIRWGFFCALFAGVYFVTNISRINFKKIIKVSLLWVIATVLNSAILILPLIQFMQLSRRAGLSTQDVGLFSIELSSLLGVIAPQIGVNYEQLIYFGILPLILMFFAFSKKYQFWILSACFCLLYSLGENTFFFPLVNKIFPFLTWLRVPSRAWFFLVFSVIVLSSIGLHQVLAKNYSKTFKKKFTVVIVVFCTFAVLFAIGMRIIFGYIPSGIQFMAIMIPISMILVFWLLTDKKNREIQIFVLFIIVIGDLMAINNTILKSRPLPEKSNLVEWLENQPGLFRVYSPSYSFPMPNTLQQANGVNPMHLATYAEFIKSASNYSSGPYSVSLPDVYIDNHTPEELVLAAQYPDTELLGLLNVKYLASNFELKSTNLQLLDRYDNHYLYENKAYRERIWYEAGKVDLEKWSPNEIRILTEGNAGKLILSEVYYPGWKAWIDGEEVEINREYEILRSVEIDSGSHEIVFKFLPISFFLGMVLSLVGWLAFFFLEIFYRSKLGGGKND
jgi:succinate dehydrogenase hydrophobic anchor subunit